VLVGGNLTISIPNHNNPILNFLIQSKLTQVPKSDLGTCNSARFRKKFGE
jgi:hypothetical protein